MDFVLLLLYSYSYSILVLMGTVVSSLTLLYFS